jgi:hypothetical protein
MPLSSTSSSNNNGRLRTFTKTLGVFFLPVFVLAVVAEIWCFRYGENWTLKMVRDAEAVAMREGKESLFHRLVIPEEMRRYKLGELVSRNPRVIVAGSSTSMQFRSFMFGDCASDFYNAGGLTNSVDQLADLLSVLALLHRVELVFIGVDPWWLNPAWTAVPSEGFGQETEGREFVNDLRTNLLPRKGGVVWLRSIRSAISAVPPDGHVAIGLGGRNGDGFRGSDGSRRYAFVAARAKLGAPFVDVSTTIDRIRSGTDRFERANSIAYDRLSRLEDFLNSAAQKNVMVAGYSIPLEPMVHAAIMQSDGHKEFYRQYLRSTAEVFERTGHPFLHADDPRAWGFDSSHMVDGFHASEVLFARLVHQFLQLPATQKALQTCRITNLERQIAEAPSPFVRGGPKRPLHGGERRPGVPSGAGRGVR